MAGTAKGTVPNSVELSPSLAQIRLGWEAEIKDVLG